MTGFTYFRHNVSKLREAQEDMGHPRTHMSKWLWLKSTSDEGDTQEVTRPVVRCSPWGQWVLRRNRCRSGEKGRRKSFLSDMLSLRGRSFDRICGAHVQEQG